jgi:hypothetical protein
VARNPKDTAVSLFHHAKSKPEFGYTGDFTTFCEIFLAGVCVPQYTHLENVRCPPLLLLTTALIFVFANDSSFPLSSFKRVFSSEFCPLIFVVTIQSAVRAMSHHYCPMLVSVHDHLHLNFLPIPPQGKRKMGVGSTTSSIGTGNARCANYNSPGSTRLSLSSAP